MKTVHLIISGKVQGVFFRAEAKDIAGQLNVKGWIKNTADKRVEALVTGYSEDIDKFINWCRSGPEKANVQDVVTTQRPKLLFEKFEIIR